MPAKTPQQRTVSSLMEGGSRSNASAPSKTSSKQSSITSFFQAKPSTPKSSMATPEKRTGVTPLVAEQLRLAETPDAMQIDSDDLEIDEEEFIRPAVGKKSRIIADDEEDEDGMGGGLQSSPGSGPAQQLPNASPAGRRAAPMVSSSPLARKKGSAPAPPRSTLAASVVEDDDMMMEGGGGREARHSWLANVRDAEGNKPGTPEYDPRTLYIPPSAWSKFTPFEKQFWEIKGRLMDTVVFFKKGKFYELYEGDADIGAQLFDLKMTDRVNMRMVGVPEATFDWWAGRFVAAGHRIARVDQTETAISKGMKDRDARSKGDKADKIIKRELSQILTAGTLVDPGLLVGRDQATYCMALCHQQDGTLGLAFVDAAAAVFRLAGFADDAPAWPQLATLLLQVRPRELVVPRGRVAPELLRLVRSIVPEASIIQAVPGTEFWDARRTNDELDRAASSGATWPSQLRDAAGSSAMALSASGALLWYLRELRLDSQLLVSPVFEHYDAVRSGDRLVLDAPTLANLDVLVGKGSLLGLLDRCCTPMGRRLLRLWVCHPLRRVVDIQARQETVDLLLAQGHALMASLQRDLSALPDLERLLSRLHSGTARVPDFLTVLEGLQRALALLERLGGQVEESDPRGAYLRALLSSRPDAATPLAFFQSAFDHAAARRDNCILPAAGVHAGYDAAQAEVAGAQSALADYLREQETRLKTRGLRYKDMGKELYQLEVPASLSVPSEYLLMSKTKAVNRYWTPAIKEHVRRFQEAEVLRAEALQNIFADILARFREHADSWRRIATLLAELDCLLSLARCSASMAEPKCRPTLLEPSDPEAPGVLEMHDLRHPCIPPEREASFIPNDVLLTGQQRMLILTGPNMGGKSTLLRQVRSYKAPGTNCRLAWLRSWPRSGATCRPPAPSSRLSTASSPDSAPTTTSSRDSPPSW